MIATTVKMGNKILSTEGRLSFLNAKPTASWCGLSSVDAFATAIRALTQTARKCQTNFHCFSIRPISSMKEVLGKSPPT